MPSWGWTHLNCWIVGHGWWVSVEGGVSGGVWGGKRGMVVFQFWMVGGGVCVERVLTASVLRLGTCVVGDKEG